MKEISLIVYGRVQGVNFRNNISDYAEREGIKGNVFNREDGAVGIAAQGSEKKLKGLIKWVKTSPGFSNVTNVNETWREPKEIYGDFNVVKGDSIFEDQKSSFRNLAKSFFNKKV